MRKRIVYWIYSLMLCMTTVSCSSVTARSDSKASLKSESTNPKAITLSVPEKNEVIVMKVMEPGEVEKETAAAAEKRRNGKSTLEKEALTLIPGEKAADPIKKVQGLVRIEDIDSSIISDLRYAGEDNFTHKVIYPVDLCALQESTVRKLSDANKEFSGQGYRIKIWDAYRPLKVEKVFWDLVGDERFVADPQKGSQHNRGTAVDITLVDDKGRELLMPTGFDEFSEKASRNYGQIPKEAKKNLDFLTSVMKKHGFTVISNEWWHFVDADWRQYPILDIDLDELTL